MLQCLPVQMGFHTLARVAARVDGREVLTNVESD